LTVYHFILSRYNKWVKNVALALCSTLVVLLAGVLFPVYVRAQLSPQAAAQVNDQDVSFVSDPEVPGAFTSTTITVDSYLTDVSRAYFIWKKDGVTSLSATGANTYTFTTGDIGKKTTILVNMLLPTGETIQKQLVFNPSEVDLVWEGYDSYTPPFYRGRSLPTSEGAIRVLAVPQINNTGAVADVSNYVFKWTRDDAVDSDNSGYNKSSLLFAQDYLTSVERIEVRAQDNASSSIADGKISVGTFQPKVLMYASDPILGIDWAHEVGNFLTVTKSEKSLLAIPYFFSPSDPLSSNLTYAWTINGEDVQTPSIKNMLTIKSGTSKGISTLKLTVTNAFKLFLDGEKSVTVNLQ
jgi:hypothetical protein